MQTFRLVPSDLSTSLMIFENSVEPTPCFVMTSECGSGSSPARSARGWNRASSGLTVKQNVAQSLRLPSSGLDEVHEPDVNDGSSN